MIVIKRPKHAYSQEWEKVSMVLTLTIFYSVLKMEEQLGNRDLK